MDDQNDQNEQKTDLIPPADNSAGEDLEILGLDDLEATHSVGDKWLVAGSAGGCSATGCAGASGGTK